MRLIDTASYSFKALRERRTRSILTILGIAVGSGLIIALLSLGEGISTSVTNQLLTIGANNVIILPAQGSTIRFTDIDAQRISRIPYVSSVAPFYSVPAEFKVGGVSINGRILGIDPLILQLFFPGIKVEEGLQPSGGSSTQVCVGYKVAHPPVSTVATRLYVGQPLTITAAGSDGIKTNSYTVSCIYSKFGASLFFDADTAVVMPLPAARRLLGETRYQAILVNTDRVDQINYIISEIESMYGRNVIVISPSTILNTVRSIIGSFTIFLAVIASVSLFVAGLGIMNTMIMSVMERTREIGVLRSVGMKRREVLLVFLFEAILTGLIGGVIGVGMGVGLSVGFSGYAQNFLRFGPGFDALPITPIIRPENIVGTLIFALLVGSVSGLYPARRASLVDPVMALKTE
jgi:putative ABC transport system permease protein